MQTQSIVRGAAEVLTITTLRVNDCYKRIESDYSGDATLRFGVVTDVMDNGPDAAVVSLEFRPADYGSGVQFSRKVINGNAPLAIFPARPDEVREHMDKVLEAAHRAESTAQDALDRATENVRQVLAVGRLLGEDLLTTPETSTEPLPVAPPADED